MAIALEATFHGRGFDDRQVLRVAQAPGQSLKARSRPELLFHWVEATPNGYRVTHVWKDKAACESSSRRRCGPVSVQLGVPNCKRVHRRRQRRDRRKLVVSVGDAESVRRARQVQGKRSTGLTRVRPRRRASGLTASPAEKERT